MIEKDVVIVGGGLVGSLLATMLAKRGHEVTVFERRSGRSGAGKSAGRSINLVVTRRGLEALRLVGLDRPVLDLTVSVRGRMMHSSSGDLSYQPYGRDESECNYSISRSGLNAFLVDRAREEGADFVFDHELTGGDPETGILHFKDCSSGASVEVKAGVVFGTDGAFSALRASFRKYAGFEDSIEWLEHGYKEFLIPPGPNGEFQLEKNALHIWPRGEFMLMALPNLDASFTGTFYLRNEGDPSFESLGGTATQAPSEVRRLFERNFPDFVSLVPDFEDQFFANPTGTLGTVRCYPWHCGSRFLLLGDAAHAVVPFFGQGMNTGFEDCTLLIRLLEENGEGEWGDVFRDLSERRKRHADAIAAMAIENFSEMREKVGDKTFLLRKAVEHRLEEVMPEIYRSRYSMVMFSSIPFADAQDVGAIQDEIIATICAGIDSAEDVDLQNARVLIENRLSPFLRSRNISLDY